MQSGVWVAGNERIDGAAIIKKKSFVPENFVYVHVAMKVKFALEQPSSTGVGHAKLTHIRARLCL